MRLKGKSQIDRAIGQRLRAYRLAAGMSQTAVGDHLGVTFQQIQKYEKGVNRLSGARLVAVMDLSRAQDGTSQGPYTFRDYSSRTYEDGLCHTVANGPNSLSQ